MASILQRISDVETVQTDTPENIQGLEQSLSGLEQDYSNLTELESNYQKGLSGTGRKLELAESEASALLTSAYGEAKNIPIYTAIWKHNPDDRKPGEPTPITSANVQKEWGSLKALRNNLSGKAWGYTPAQAQAVARNIQRFQEAMVNLDKKLEEVQKYKQTLKRYEEALGETTEGLSGTEIEIDDISSNLKSEKKQFDSLKFQREGAMRDAIDKGRTVRKNLSEL